jgi:hypothetical protein
VIDDTKVLGWTACLACGCGGIVLFMAIWESMIVVTVAWADWRYLGITAVAEVLGLILGIFAWQTPQGKAAVLVASPLTVATVLLAAVSFLAMATAGC